MSDKPIPFSAPMVRALLREIEEPGTGKTQTRRVIDFPGVENVLAFVPVATDQRGRRIYEMKDASGQFITRPAGKNLVEYHYWPKYAVDDRLYVREAWRAEAVYDDTSPRAIEADACMVRYEADGTWSDRDAMTHAGRFRQGMHMPRWASRITLFVTDVRVQLLQEISEEDAIAEGVECWSEPGLCSWRVEDVMSLKSAVDAYAQLWTSLNAARGYGWEANPWVAAYTFRPILGNIEQIGGA
ncbi:hypothetical protein [Synechococcus phage Ssp-JY39]|nr:hypothetical protein [Synechococcus phage Yong-M2-251]